MQEQVWFDRGDLVASAMWSAKRDWRDAWAKGVTVDDLFASQIKYTETVITERPLGRLEILVRIIAVKHGQSEAFFYKFLRNGNAWRQEDGV